MEAPFCVIQIQFNKIVSFISHINGGLTEFLPHCLMPHTNRQYFSVHFFLFKHMAHQKLSVPATSEAHETWLAYRKHTLLLL
jgi:hypothetical protein